jgi:hypothetical protein
MLVVPKKKDLQHKSEETRTGNARISIISIELEFRLGVM